MWTLNWEQQSPGEDQGKIPDRPGAAAQQSPWLGVRVPVAQAVGIGAAPRLCGQAKDFMYLISFKFKLSTYFKRKIWGKPPPNPKNFALQVRILQQLHFFMIQRHPSEKKIMVLGKSASAESVCGSWGSVKYSLKLRGRCKDP